MRSTTATTVTIMPMALKTFASKDVAKLKWDGTPRQVCIVMSAVSATLTTPRDPSNTHDDVLPSRRAEATQAIVAAVMPNDNPNRSGLRQDSGPSNEPPVTNRTMPWKMPEAISNSPHASKKRCGASSPPGGCGGGAGLPAFDVAESLCAIPPRILFRPHNSFHSTDSAGVQKFSARRTSWAAASPRSGCLILVVL